MPKSRPPYRLAAAGLDGGHVHDASRVLQQPERREPDRREPDRGTEEIDEAGDEQPDPGAGGCIVGRLPGTMEAPPQGCRPILSGRVKGTARK